MKEYDVWVCCVSGRTSYKTVPATGPVEDAQPPAGSLAHIDRVKAANARQAVYFAVRDFKARQRVKR